MINRFWPWLMALCLHMPSGWAQNRDFQIEILAFAQNDPTSERFELAPSRIKWPPFWLDSSDFKTFQQDMPVMSGERQKLERGVRYRVLKTWRFSQTIAEQQAGDAVRLVGIETLDGWVRLKRGDYLELSVDVEYQPDPTQPRYHIQETRLIRFDEPHYFDHPRFGLLLTVQD